MDLEHISPLFFADIYVSLYVCNQEKLLCHMFWDTTGIWKILHFGPSFQQTSGSTRTQIDGVDIASLLKHKNSPVNLIKLVGYKTTWKKWLGAEKKGLSVEEE